MRGTVLLDQRTLRQARHRWPPVSPQLASGASMDADHAASTGMPRACAELALVIRPWLGWPEVRCALLVKRSARSRNRYGVD